MLIAEWRTSAVLPGRVRLGHPRETHGEYVLLFRHIGSYRQVRNRRTVESLFGGSATAQRQRTPTEAMRYEEPAKAD